MIDSFSSDRTTDIAHEFGARVISHDYANWGSQCNFGISQALNDWVLVIDADEVVCADVWSAIASLPGTGDETSYAIRRRNIVFGKWLRHGGWYPDWTTRLVRRGFGAYEDRSVHQMFIAAAASRRIDAELIHYTYDTVADYVTKANQYSTREVANQLADRRIGWSSWLRTPSKTKVKVVLSHIGWAKPILRFTWMYVVRLGLLDGKAGLNIALLSAITETIAHIKMWEHAKREVSRDLSAGSAGTTQSTTIGG